MKFLLKCILIGFPVLLILGFAFQYYEDNQNSKGTKNDKGGLNFMYQASSGCNEIPAVASAFVTMYPNGETVYFNLSTDSIGVLSGHLTTYTQDDFSKVKEFYKNQGKIILENEERLELNKNKTEIVITKENLYEDDPIKNQTKFNISFN